MKPPVEVGTPVVKTELPSIPCLEPSASPPPAPARKARLFMYGAGLLSLMVLIFFAARTHSNKSTARNAKNAGFFGAAQRTIRLTGSTEAVQMRAIVAPILQGQHMGML